MAGRFRCRLMRCGCRLVFRGDKGRRYIARPAVAEPRLSLTKSGNVRYELKTPYRNGTTHVIFEPLDFMARLAALVPKPRINLTRYHGVFAPNSAQRAAITPSQRGKGSKKTEGTHAIHGNNLGTTPSA
jgi:hypothetical protein